MTSHDLDSIPWVPLPLIHDADGLMQFDRQTCIAFHQFKRPAHPFDGPPGRSFDHRRATVIVTALGPGLRVRLVTKEAR